MKLPTLFFIQLILFMAVFVSCTPTTTDPSLLGSTGTSTTLQRMPALKLPQTVGDYKSTSWVKKDRPTLVHLWATWCPPCQQELLELKTLWQIYSKQFDFLLIAVASNRTAVQSVTRQHTLPFNSLLDLNAQLPAKLATLSMPVTLFVDSYGEILEVPDPNNLQLRVSRIEGARNWLSKEATITMESVLQFEAMQPKGSNILTAEKQKD